MNVFEDLIDELKEENLIEETVIVTGKAKAILAKSESEKVKIESAADQATFLTNETVEPAAVNSETSPMTDFEEILEELSETVETEAADDTNFFRQRAMEEVAFLQMVESAFAGVERDQMKIVPTFYDDLEVKKILHSFLQISPNASTAEHSQAEFQLLQATENWFSTLAARDKRIMTAQLRRYWETSRPPLSKPALIALARFYRNSPYLEAVRSKFDLMITRIFAREPSGNRREIVFSRDELAERIKELYAEWSSVPLYSTDADDEGIRQTITQFEEFIEEADAANDFDELINSNFFNRLRLFKKSTNEDFYAPPVAAMGIEMNVHLGNRYAELLENEKRKEGKEDVESKYGFSYDHTISETMGKTMSLAELLKPKPFTPPAKETPDFDDEPYREAVESNEKESIAEKKKFKVWILAAVILVVVAVGIYFGFGFASPETPETSSASPPSDGKNNLLTKL
ncbi:MAG: hypothetical protein LH472_00385 [Pyrinomonadaceae bacterium]|nr:hypothetical protein [Pyrinomonadaceae bacterium]